MINSTITLEKESDVDNRKTELKSSFPDYNIDKVYKVL